jgi:hypothetical protein
LVIAAANTASAPECVVPELSLTFVIEFTFEFERETKEEVTGLSSADENEY